MPFYRYEPSSNAADSLNHPGFREDPWNLRDDTCLEGTLERQKWVPHANCLALALTRMVFPVSLPHHPEFQRLSISVVVHPGQPSHPYWRHHKTDTSSKAAWKGRWVTRVTKPRKYSFKIEIAVVIGREIIPGS